MNLNVCVAYYRSVFFVSFYHNNGLMTHQSQHRSNIDHVVCVCGQFNKKEQSKFVFAALRSSTARHARNIVVDDRGGLEGERDPPDDNCDIERLH